jgi:hypothetical protein
VTWALSNKLPGGQDVDDPPHKFEKVWGRVDPDG